MFRRVALILVLAVLPILFSAVVAQDAPTIAVLTPYLAQPGTQFMVEGFQAATEAKGWTVNVIDTAGDVAALNSRVQDVVTQAVDAIVINVDPSQIPALAEAVAAGIPVFGMDAGSTPEVLVNVTSNGYEMASVTATYVVDRLNGVGRIVMFGFNPYPPVQKRGVVAQAIFGNTPDIEIVEFIEPDVTDGGIADSRARMEAILAANPEPGSISAVWAAWDQPALGALQAIEAAGREGEGIVITGIDANPQALEAIAQAGNFEASIAQDFSGIGSLVADQIERYLAGETLTQRVVYAPTKLITAANVADMLP
ncbi:MAG: substrate-binding domain-containing protein [Chloroflexi bacterium]|nr:substrate-binding domain-containing protein [Chloroflexota bacterium]